MSNILGQEEESGNHGLDTTIGTEFNFELMVLMLTGSRWFGEKAQIHQIQSLFFGVGLSFIKLTKYAICKL